MIQQMLANWSLVPLTFLNPACTSGSSPFMYCWSLAWSILRSTLLACTAAAAKSLQLWNEYNCTAVWTFFEIALLWNWNENWPFQSCGHCWVFQICWHIECSTWTALSFRIWNSSAAIPSPPLALFIVMLPKAHLASHSRMSGSRSVITPSWLSRSLRSFHIVLLWILATYS